MDRAVLGKMGLGKGRNQTRVWCDLDDGKQATTVLDAQWNGRVTAGDRLDALTDARSGRILRLLSASPAQA